MRRFTWYIGLFFEGLISGDRHWGHLRLITLWAFGLLGFLVFCVVFNNVTVNLFKMDVQAVEGVRVTNPEQRLPQPDGRQAFLTKWFKVIWNVLWLNQRFLVAPFVAFLVALLVGARYIQDIYELKSYRSAMWYLLSSMFSSMLLWNYPTLFVSNGQKQIRPDEVNPLDAIGGPGYVVIEPGNVVLFERLHATAAVRSEGLHFISRFERIKDIINLTEQEGELAEVGATTKDGIEVKVRNVRFRFRLRPGRRLGGLMSRTWEEPYPFSVRAVRDMVYNRSVNEDGSLTSWFMATKFIIETAITDYINTHSIDDLTAPGKSGEDARAKIKKDLYGRGARMGLKNLGAELLWCDIGFFDVPDSQIADQRLEAWQTRWIGDAERLRGEAESRRMANQELGRAEGQAELLNSIAQALQDTGLKGDSRANLRSIVLIRTAQILEALAKPGASSDAQAESDRSK